MDAHFNTPPDVMICVIPVRFASDCREVFSSGFVSMSASCKELCMYSISRMPRWISSRTNRYETSICLNFGDRHMSFWSDMIHAWLSQKLSTRELVCRISSGKQYFRMFDTQSAFLAALAYATYSASKVEVTTDLCFDDCHRTVFPRTLMIHPD